jgi:Leucine-rich repeat (LRR) protein
MALLASGVRKLILLTLKVEKIQGYGCKLDELILNNFPGLIYIYVPFNCLRKLEIKDCEEIEILFCNNNNLKELDINELTNLKKIYCYRNMLETLDCRELRGLREFFATRKLLLKRSKAKATSLVGTYRLGRECVDFFRY